MDYDVEYVCTKSGRVGIFLPCMEYHCASYKISGNKLILCLHNGHYSELNPPAVFINQARRLRRMLVVECKGTAIFKEYEIELEI